MVVEDGHEEVVETAEGEVRMLRVVPTGLEIPRDKRWMVKSSSPVMRYQGTMEWRRMLKSTSLVLRSQGTPSPDAHSRFAHRSCDTKERMLSVQMAEGWTRERAMSRYVFLPILH